MKIDLNAKDLAKLIRYYKTAPKKFAMAAGMWENRAAFGSRENVIEYMDRYMTVRNRGFVKSSLRVQKSRYGAAMRAQQSEMGSIKRERFTGWAEQEGLATDKRNKTIGLAARGGSIGKRVAPAARLKKGRARPKPGDYKGKSRNAKASRMLNVLHGKRYRGAFIVAGHEKVPSGLYRFGKTSKGKRSIIMLQGFKRRPKRPARRPWMRHSVKKYFRDINRKKVWASILRRIK